MQSPWLWTPVWEDVKVQSWECAKLPEPPSRIKLRQVYPTRFFIFTYGDEAYIVRYGDEYGWGLGFVCRELVPAILAYAKVLPNCQRVYLEGQPYDEELSILYDKDPNFDWTRRGARDLDERAFLKRYLPGLAGMVDEPELP
jgi:hypothetical protein